MSKINFRALLILLSFLLATSSLRAQAPRLLNYQGKLNTAATGTFRMAFTIYPDSTGSAILWTERHEKVNIAAGVFKVLLGSINPFPANLFTTAGDRYLGIAIGNDAEIMPRWRFTSVPYAMSAGRADTAKSKNDRVDNDWAIAGNNMYASVTGNVGIGTATPSEKLVVGDDLGSPLPGNRLTVGNRDSHSVINLGENLDNRALAGWIDGNNFLRFFTVDNTKSYHEQNLVLKDGKAGLGTMIPAALLDIVPPKDSDIPNILSRNSFLDLATVRGQVIQFGLYDIARRHFAETMRLAYRLGIGTTLTATLAVGDTATTNRPILSLQRHPQATSHFIEGYNGYDRRSLRSFYIDRNGTYNSGSDFAETLPAKPNESGYEPGEVLVFCMNSPPSVEKCHQSYDTKVIGVYSRRPALLGADKAGETRAAPDEIPVAIAGIVHAKVSTHNGTIMPGDWLTTSEMAGHAMKAKPMTVNGVSIYPAGTILGRATESLHKGTGEIKILLMLQ